MSLGSRKLHTLYTSSTGRLYNGAADDEDDDDDERDGDGEYDMADGW